MMTQKRSRFALGIAGLFALTVAVARCSPLAPSIAKDSYRSAHKFPTSPVRTPRIPVQGAELNAIEVQTTISSVDQDQPVVVAFYPAADRKISARTMLLDQKQHQRELEELRLTGEAEIDLREIGSFQSVRAQVKLNLSPESIREQPVAEIKLLLRPLKSGTFLLSISREESAAEEAKEKVSVRRAQEAIDHVILVFQSEESEPASAERD